MITTFADGLGQSLRVIRAFEKAGRAAHPASLRATSAEALQLLQPLASFEMASLSYWDPELATHRSVVNLGYPNHVITLSDALMHFDAMFQLMQRDRVPLRLRGLNPAALSGVVGTKIILRNSFRDGLTHCFYNESGRYLGYVNLSSRVDDLTEATPALVQLLEASIVPVLQSAAKASGTARPTLDALTPREREVLALLPSGATNGEIAAALSVSSATIARHIEHVIAKLGAQNRTRAACIAVELGISVPGSTAAR